MTFLLFYSVLFIIFTGSLSQFNQFQPTLSHPLSAAPSDETTSDKSWTNEAIRRLWLERKKMQHTPIFKYNYPGQPHVDIVFKNESASKTGSLKHRYAWSLMMWALIEGHVQNGSTIYEASSGNTAASLGYMCSLTGNRFIAIVPDTIEQVKVNHIMDYQGTVIKVPISQRLTRAKQEAEENNGFFMNQFGNADRAEEYHESGDFPLESVNLFHELLAQLDADHKQIVKAPHYFIHSAGTGGTISSVGRYVKKYGVNTEVVMADTQFSVYYDYILHHRFRNESGSSMWVEPGMAGIGYGPMGEARKGETTSLDPAVIDRVVKIPDIASTAAMRVLRDQGISGGTSSGVNFLSALHIASTNTKQLVGRLTIAILLADPAYYYENSYYNRNWIAEKFAQHGGLEAYDCWIAVISESLITGADPLFSGYQRCPTGRFRL